MGLPTTYQDLTPSWFSKILKGVHIKPETFKVTPNVQAGIGFLSMMVRVEFKTEAPENNSDFRRKYNLIVKLLPDENSFLAEARDAVLQTNLDQVEINVYRFLLPDFIQEIPDLGKHICKLHYAGIQEADLATQTPYTSVLVLEDLRPPGYTTKLYAETLSPTEYAQGLDFLASFHVACKSLEYRKGATLPELYHWFPNWLNSVETLRSGQVPSLSAFFEAGFDPLYEFLEAQSKYDLIQHYKNLESRSDKILQVILLAAQEHPCAIHMDLWSHNVLVNSDPDKPVQVIDWQMLGYADPMFDVAVYALATLPIEEMNRTGIVKALRSYFYKYAELCAEKKLSLDRSYEEFEQFLMTYGLSFGLFWFVMSTLPIRNVPGSQNKHLRGLEFFVELGITDFVLSVT